MKRATWAIPALAGLLLTGLVLAGPLTQAGRPATAATAAPRSTPATPTVAAAMEDVTAQDLVLAYQGDAATADRRFKGVRFTVHGKIADIDTDAKGNPFLTLAGGASPGVDPRLSFGKEGWQALATWTTGSKITLVCTGRGATAGQPTADSCFVP